MQTAEFLFEKAEQCSLLAKSAGCTCGAKNEITAELVRLGNELMAKAIELETARQKAARSIQT